MDDVIEESIFKLFEDFKRIPESYKDEKILTYKFYDIIIGKYQDYKFRWEYPTKSFYVGNTPVEIARKSKSIDICFVKDDNSETVPYALEFKLLLTKKISGSTEEDEFYPSKFKIIDPDFEELCERRNKIGLGYIVFFAYVEIINEPAKKEAHIFNKKEFFNKYDDLKSKIPLGQPIKIIFVCVDNLDRDCRITP